MKPQPHPVLLPLPLAGEGRGEGLSESIRRVVGLKYDPDDGLPQVIFKGAGPLADEILASRRARVGAHVVRNEALLQSLYRLPLDARIGPELFHVVAVILAHVFALEAQLKNERRT
jgi:type III secretion system FlhB-like substrate exporter